MIQKPKPIWPRALFKTVLDWFLAVLIVFFLSLFLKKTWWNGLIEGCAVGMFWEWYTPWFYRTFQ